jgi:tetratricopeptide (TPR) repeat protein
MMSNKKIIAAMFCLAALTLLVFWHVMDGDFINLDDYDYVAENNHIQEGVTPGAIRWAFTTFHTAYWHPLTWMSHMLDIHLFGLNPRWHHLTNLLFHVANSLLLFRVFHRMTRAFWQSAAVAALFAIHPLHVESVAWVSERKDLLSAFFWLLTMGAYVRYVERPGRWGYGLVLLFLLMGLMSKPMVVTLPFALLLLDYWPLQRLEVPQTASAIRPGLHDPAATDQRGRKAKRKRSAQALDGSTRIPASEMRPLRMKSVWASIRPLLLEKAPLFVLVVSASIAAVIAQQQVGALGSIEALPLGARVANAFVAYAFYIRKMIWPTDLAIFYPHHGSWPVGQVVGAVIFFSVATLVVIRKARAFPYMAVGWFWYAGTLIPVIGIVQVGGQAAADRYTYIPLVGLFIILAWGVPDLLKRLRYRRGVLVAASALTLLGLILVTRVQVGYWRDSLTLFDHTISVTENNALILSSRGAVLDRMGEHSKALADYNRAIELDPGYSIAYCNRGAYYYKMGDYYRAIADYEEAIRIDARYPVPYVNRGAAYQKLGDPGRAIADFDRAIHLNPNMSKAYLYRGIARHSLGDYRLALSDYDRAIEMNSRETDVYFNRGSAHYLLGEYDKAIADFNRAIVLNPGDAEALFNRGAAYDHLHDYRRAVADYDRAIELNPSFSNAYRNRGAAYLKAGDNDLAWRDLKTAARLGSADARAFLASRGMDWK